MPAVRETLSHALRLVLALTVPATFGLIALGVPIVRVIFERGRFLPSDTEAVALALMGYAPGLVGYSAVKVLSPTFYALRDSRTPVIVSVTAVLMNAVLNILLARAFGFPGLSLGTALASLFNASLLLVLLRRRLGPIGIWQLVSMMVRITIASAVMGATAWALHDWLATHAVVGQGFLAQVVRVGASIGAALLVLAGMARLLRVTEFDEAFGKLFRRLRGRRPGQDARG
jgi:putative peptidoglycan lipid II flippase